MFRKVFNVWTKSHLKNFVFRGKCLTLDLDLNFECLNLDFQNWPKILCLGVSKPEKRLAAQSTACGLRNRQGKQAFVKENEKKKKKIYVKEV